MFDNNDTQRHKCYPMCFNNSNPNNSSDLGSLGQCRAFRQHSCRVAIIAMAYRNCDTCDVFFFCCHRRCYVQVQHTARRQRKAHYAQRTFCFYSASQDMQQHSHIQDPGSDLACTRTSQTLIPASSALNFGLWVSRFLVRDDEKIVDHVCD